jgi:hypothetical protein
MFITPCSSHVSDEDIHSSKPTMFSNSSSHNAIFSNSSPHHAMFSNGSSRVSDEDIHPSKPTMTEMKPLQMPATYHQLYQNHQSVLAALNTPPPALLQVGHLPTSIFL